MRKTEKITCFATSFFNRRRMKGRITPCSLATMARFTLSPSTMEVNGLLNQYLNSVIESNTFGMRKCNNDHSSIMEFCNGVPVSSNRRCVLKCNNVFHRCDLKFLMFCASSKIMKYLEMLEKKYQRTKWCFHQCFVYKG